MALTSHFTDGESETWKDTILLVRTKAGIQGRDWSTTVRKKYQFHITAFDDDIQLVPSLLPFHISGRSLPGREAGAGGGGGGGGWQSTPIWKDGEEGQLDRPEEGLVLPPICPVPHSKPNSGPSSPVCSLKMWPPRCLGLKFYDSS